MTVYVDDLARYPTKIPCFRLGSCHMMADTLDELHAMAAKIGLKRAWFQDHPHHPHYDLTASKRVDALQAGAVYKSAKEQARERRARRSCAGLSFTEKGS